MTMDKPTEARQNELAGIREKMASIELRSGIHITSFHDNHCHLKDGFINQILSLAVSSGGGVCNECRGAGTKLVGVFDCKGRFERPCPTCNGTGVVEKTLLEWAKLGMER